MTLRVCDRCENKACSNEDEENANFYFNCDGADDDAVVVAVAFVFVIFSFCLFWA